MADRDLDKRNGCFSLRAEQAARYRSRFDLDRLRQTEFTDPLARRLDENAELLGTVEELIRSAPRPERSLDHVSATAETVVRRALWLDSTFDLAGSRLLCVGDHDLTSLAIAMMCPSTSVTVVDIDERILEFIAGTARQRGLDIQCLYADLRLGLPRSALGSADLAVTDPPYTPEGVRLFLARGIQGLRDTDTGRLLMAYGFSPRQPALGLYVQRAVLGLHLAIEGIIPNFNRYDGAQAVGSAADWYICQPTPKSRRIAQRTADEGLRNIYTHGTQSIEAGNSNMDKDLGALLAEVDESAVLIGSDWPKSVSNHPRVSLETLLGSGVPAVYARRNDLTIVANIADDPGTWLLRILLATNAYRVLAMVDNRHPDIRNQAGQTTLRTLLGAKYEVRFKRSWQGGRYAVVEAERVHPGQLQPSDRLVNRILTRAHGTVGNTWRDGLTKLDPGRTVTKSQARALIQAAASSRALLDRSLIELCRADIATVIADVRRAGVSPPSDDQSTIS